MPASFNTAKRKSLLFCSARAAMLLLVVFAASSSLFAQDSEAMRTTRGLQVLYTFSAGEGQVVHDRSGSGEPLHLTIQDAAAVRWEDSSLSIQSPTIIRSRGPARKVSSTLKRIGSVTLEAWIQPANIDQDGPARILSLSANPSSRNFTLGQDANSFEIRYRTSNTSTNGAPSTSTPANTATTGLSHVVYTRDAAGTIRVYINGRQLTTNRVAGNLVNWDESFPLLLANEATGDRPWLGSYHLIAIFNRPLSANEVAQHYKAGPEGAEADPVKIAERQKAIFFETRIAPLLANRCLDCHDAATQKGKLNLAIRDTALAGGENGKAIIPGKPEDSLLWQRVDAGDMPPKGDPLNDEQKADLRQWLEDGASWSVSVLDPAVYARSPEAGRNWIRRLTVPEYIETVRVSLGIDIADEAWQHLPRDLRADGFSNTAYNLGVDLKHVEAYSRLAETAVGKLDALKFAARFSRSRSLSTDATMRQFVASMGEWLLRGPLDEREVTNYSGIATTVASTGGDYEEAVRFIIEAMIQSPRFIYRVENQLGDGTDWPINDFELASRLSYIIWGGPPDNQLLTSARDGILQRPGTMDAEITRMLADPRAIEHSTRFLVEWLDLDRLENLTPNKKRFPGWSPELASDMRAETVAFFKDVVWQQKRPLVDLLDAQFTYATPLLARHYGIPPQGPGLTRYDLSNVAARGGLMTQASTLTIGGDDASMVTRGLFVLHDLLRGTVKAPPPGLDTTPVPSKPGLSQRLIAEQRIANVACRGCHSRFEPLAFGLEQYDGIGAHHEKDEHGNTLRSDGEVLIPGAAKPIPYKTTAELMNLLSRSDRVRLTLTWKITQFALGRPLVARDAPIVDGIDKAAAEEGGTYIAVIKALVLSDLVQRTRTVTLKEADNP